MHGFYRMRQYKEPHMDRVNKLIKTASDFIKKETVLSAAAVLAVASCFLVPPDKSYPGYIDFRTLALLFSLMAVTAGLRSQGVFYDFGRILLSKAGSVRQIVLVLMLLCFFSSMLITNDVALITFVPFSFAVLGMMGAEASRRYLLPVVCIQTIAANLGSMFTPIGNPQNLYLQGKSGLSLGGFAELMLPYTLASLTLLCVWIFMLCRKRGKAKMEIDAPAKTKSRGLVIMYTLLFILCLTTVMRVLPWQWLVGIVVAAVLIADRKTLRDIDYSLLLTFVGFFIFIGNLGRIPAFSNWLLQA